MLWWFIPKQSQDSVSMDSRFCGNLVLDEALVLLLKFQAQGCLWSLLYSRVSVQWRSQTGMPIDQG